MGGRRGASFVAGLGVALALAGCGGAGPGVPDARHNVGGATEPTNGVAGAESSATVGAVTAALAQMPAPALEYVEWKLPEGATVSGHGDRFAVATEQDRPDGDGAGVILLDMDTGMQAVVVPRALGWADRFTILGLDCSDDWVVWEEVRGDEQENLLNVEWRLWVARIDAESLSISEPRLHRSSVVSMASRPLFDVIGSTLYVMTNRWPNPVQEGATYRSSIVSINLDAGPGADAGREVYSSSRMLSTFSVQADELVVCEYVDHDSPRCRVRVLGLGQGAERFSHDLGNDGVISHWPSYTDGTLLWAAEVSSDDPWPRLYCRTPDGTVRVIAEEGLDTSVVGPYVFYREYVQDGAGASVFRASPTLRGIELATMRRFELERTGPNVGGYWQPMIDSRRQDHTLVVYNQRLLGEASAEEAGTYVRRYTVP